MFTVQDYIVQAAHCGLISKPSASHLFPPLLASEEHAPSGEEGVPVQGPGVPVVVLPVAHHYDWQRHLCSITHIKNYSRTFYGCVMS